MANVDTLPEILRPLMEGPSIETPRCAVCGAPWPLNRHHIVRRGAGKLFRDGREVPKPTVMLCGSGNGSGCHGWRTPTGCTSAGSGPSRGSTAPPRRARGTGSTCCCRNRQVRGCPGHGRLGAAPEGQAAACERVRAFKRVEPPAPGASSPTPGHRGTGPTRGRAARAGSAASAARVQGAGGEAVCARDAMTGGGPDVEAVDETSEACECFEFE